MPRTFVHVMRHFEFSVSGIVDVRSVLSGTITETFPGFADVSPLAIGAHKEIDDILRLTVHLLLEMECFTVLHLD